MFPNLPRYFFEFDSNKLKHEHFDLIIVGSGLAGLSTAYYAGIADKRKSIALISSSNAKKSNSYFAQGGIAVAMGKKDSSELHASDTIKVGEGLCDEQAAKILAKEGIERMAELQHLGLKLDTSGTKVSLGREGAHSVARLAHIDGDATGKGLTDFMRKLVMENKNVHLFRNTHLLEILSRINDYHGILVLENNKKKILWSNSLVLATGGYSSLFSKSTNPAQTEGKTISVAYRAGILISNLEFEQFHPTTLAIKGAKNFLISESVRGEGAKVINGKGERILKKINGKELAARDVISMEIYKQLEQGNDIYLDIRNKGKKTLSKRFPNIYKALTKHGIAMERKLIPIEPAAHYSIGGMKTDVNCNTNIPRIFAIGEASCNGTHGANRLAGNSLLENIVFGHRAATAAIEFEKKQPTRFLNNITGKKKLSKEKISKIRNKLKTNLWKNSGIVRDRKSLGRGLDNVEEILKEIPETNDYETNTAKNIAVLSKLIFKTALARCESRGCHYRSDFPQKDSTFKKYSIARF